MQVEEIELGETVKGIDGARESKVEVDRNSEREKTGDVRKREGEREGHYCIWNKFNWTAHWTELLNSFTQELLVIETSLFY